MKKIYSGYLKSEENYDYKTNDLLLEDCFADGIFAEIQNDCHNYGSYVQFRYYVSEKEFELRDLEKYVVESYFGLSNIKIEQCGCPTCGYMSVERATIGKHNMYSELCSHEGKYAVLEIDYYKNKDEFLKRNK